MRDLDVKSFTASCIKYFLILSLTYRVALNQTRKGSSMADIRPIRKTKISDEVLAQLKHNILTGVYKPDDRLPSENALCDLFQVSRISVRTALHKLAAIGLIETRNGEGTYVRSFDSSAVLLPLLQDVSIDPATILELLEFREGVERLSCRLAARRGGAEEKDALLGIFEMMEQDAYADDQVSFTQHDIEFHRQVARMSGNTFVIRVLDIVGDLYRAHLHRMNQKISLVYSLDSHRDLSQAIRNGEEARAEGIISASIRESMRQVAEWQA